MDEIQLIYIFLFFSLDSKVKFCTCGRVATVDCQKCDEQSYCSPTCQENDVKRHQRACANNNWDIIRKRIYKKKY